jgi:hypothetical protein
MSNGKLTKDEAKQFRRRIEYEDKLLNSRTNIVLTLNGLAAVAANFSQSIAVRLCISLVIMTVDALWLVCAVDARWLITKLTERLKQSNETPADEVFRYKIQKGRTRISSTRFICIILPILLLLGWIFGLLLEGLT